MAGLTKFQFHIGAIKIIQASKQKKNLKKFQFHIGAIKIKEKVKYKKEIIKVSIPYWCD